MDDIVHERVHRLAQLPIPKALGILSFPLVMSNTLLTSHQVVNTLWVGKLGAKAIAAVSVSFPIIFLLVSLGGGLALAGSILVAQYAGARNTPMVMHVSAQSLSLVITVAALFSVAGWISAQPLLCLIGIGSDILSEATVYLQVSFLGLVFVFAFEIFLSILRGIGVVRLPLCLVACSVVLNLALDPLLIFGLGPVPARGVVGAAYATLLTEVLMAAVSLWLLLGRRYGVSLRPADFVPSVPTIKRVLLLGLPGCIEQSVDALGLTVLTAMVAGFGTTAIASYGVAFRLLVIVLIPVLGISMATATLVGHNVGAGDVVRAKRSATVSAWCSFWLLTAVAVPVWLSAESLVRLFVPRDPAVISQGASALRLMAASFGLIGVQFSLVGALRGAGDTLTPMLLTIAAVWIVQIPVAYSLSHFTSLGAVGLWCSFPVSAAVAAGYALRQMRKHHWRSVV